MLRNAYTCSDDHDTRGRLSRLVRLTLVVISGGALLLPARAHGDLHLQIQTVSAQIEVGPTGALHLKRGGLYHEHEEYPQALLDYDQAERLEPELAGIWLARGRTLFKSGRLDDARLAVNRYLQQKPDVADAHLLSARINFGLKDYASAVRGFNRNLALAREPLPECYLERAEAQVAAQDRAAAVQGLDEGISRLGNLVTLQSAAITLELALGRTEPALARVDRILSGLQRRESWLVRRGEILEVAGRPAEARAAYAEALASIDRLPVHHRETKPMHELRQQLQRRLGS